MKYEEIKNLLNYKEFPADVQEWENVSDYLKKILMEQDIEKKVAIEVTIVLEEIFVNIASYAYEGLDVKNKVMQLGTAVEKNFIYLVFIDGGVAFNPLEKEDPDFDIPVEEMQIGGLGIYMVKNWASDIAYERIDDKNILMFKKDL